MSRSGIVRFALLVEGSDVAEDARDLLMCSEHRARYCLPEVVDFSACDGCRAEKTCPVWHPESDGRTG